jgi:hypothetical protein
MKEILGLIAVALAFIGFYPYVRDIFRGKTKPHLFTYLIWSIVTALAFFGQWVSGAGPGAWTTGVMAVLTILVLVLSFKYGTEDVTRLDVIFLIAALIAIVPWWLTDDPTVSVIIATFVDVCAFFPTIRKTYNDPLSETLISYVLNLFRHGLAVLALTSFAVATYIYPVALFFMNAILVAVIVGRKKQVLS